MSSLQVRIGLERGVQGRSLAWALDFPGAFAYGKDDAEALLALPRALIQFESWVGLHSDASWVRLPEFGLKVTESFETYISDEDYEVNAFFKDDRKPPTALEIARALDIHRWQREELLAGVETLSPELVTRMLPGQRWNINGILNHIGRVEYWYLSNTNLALPSADSLVHNPFRLLETTYSLVNKHLPELEGEASVIEQGPETWSARKLLRRLLWHQRDHIEHIKELAGIPL